MIKSPFDRLLESQSETGDLAMESLVHVPLRGEMPEQTTQRVIQQQVRRGRDLAAQGIPSFPDKFGDVQPVTDEAGMPLTGYDKRTATAFDSLSAPRKIVPSAQYGAAPELRDPYESAEVTTDMRTGEQYRVVPGLPRQRVGTDESIAERNRIAAESSALAKTASALGRKLTLDESDYRKDAREYSAKISALSKESGLKDGTPEQMFAALYEKNGANKTGWFSSKPTPEAVAARSALDARSADLLEHAKRLKAREDTIAPQREFQRGIAEQRAEMAFKELESQGIDTSALRASYSQPGNNAVPAANGSLPANETSAAATPAQTGDPVAVGETLDELKKNPVGFMERLGEIGGNLEFVPYASSGVEIKHLYDIGSAASRLVDAEKAGKTGDANDAALVKQWLDRQGRDETWGAKVAGIVAGSLAFGGELAAAIATMGGGAAPSAAVRGGAEVAKRGMLALMEKGTKEIVERAVKRIFEKGAVAEIAGKTSGAVVRAGAMLPVSAPLRITTGVLRDRLPVKLSKDDEGRLVAMANDDQDGFLEAIGRNTLDQYIETLSEFSGGIFKYVPIPAKVKALKTAVLAKLGVTGRLSPLAEKLKGAFDKTAKMAAWNGVAPELGEEYIGGAMKVLAGLQSPDEAFPGKDDIIPMAIAFMVPGAARNLALAAVNNKSQSGGDGGTGDSGETPDPENPEGWPETDEADALFEELRQKNYTDEQIAAMSDEEIAAALTQGVEIGDEEPPESPLGPPPPESEPLPNEPAPSAPAAGVDLAALQSLQTDMRGAQAAGVLQSQGALDADDTHTVVQEGSTPSPAIISAEANAGEAAPVSTAEPQEMPPASAAELRQVPSPSGLASEPISQAAVEQPPSGQEPVPVAADERTPAPSAPAPAIPEQTAPAAPVAPNPARSADAIKQAVNDVLIKGKTAASLGALKVQIKQNAKLKRGWIMARAKENGDFALEIDYDAAERAIAQRPRGSESVGDPAAYIEAALREELIHFAQYEALRLKWVNGGKKGGFNAFKKRFFDELFGELQGTVEGRALLQSARDLYGENLEGWALSAEGVRQMVQLARDGKVTEGFWRKLTDMLRAVLEVLKSVAAKPGKVSKMLEQAIAETQAILDMAENETLRKEPSAESAPAATSAPAGGEAKAPPARAAEKPVVGVRKTSEFGAERENREYQIDADGQRAGQANLARNEDGTWRVEMVIVDTPGKGIGPTAYKRIHSELEAEGSGLTSGGTGSLSAAAIRMWEKLVAAGEAEKTGNTYRMKLSARAAEKPVEKMTEEIAGGRISQILNQPLKSTGKPRVQFGTKMEIAAFKHGFMSAVAAPGELPPAERTGLDKQGRKLDDAWRTGWSHGQTSARELKGAQTAISERNPVSAAAVDAYGIKLPDGWKKAGDLYVPPKAAPAPAAPAPGAPSGIRTQDQTVHAGKSYQQLLDEAKPLTEFGPNYNRNIADSYWRLKQSVDRNDKFRQLAADELAVRLEKWGPPPASPAPEAAKAAAKSETAKDFRETWQTPLTEAKEKYRKWVIMRAEKDAPLQYALRIAKESIEQYADRMVKDYDAGHRDVVSDAIREGKPVPAEVLADYPDLQPASPAPEAAKPALTPLQQQITDLKAQAPDALLAVRLGDFYEFFDEDAKAVAKTLGIALTNRTGVPMAGVPIHSPRFKELAKAGHRVAVADVTGEATPGKPAKREIIETHEPEAEKAAPSEMQKAEAKAAVIKVEHHIDDAKRGNAVTEKTPKQIKDELIARLEKSISEAPDESSADPDTRRIKIHIPGDGTFTLLNTKSQLSEMLARVKRLSTSASPSGVPQSKASLEDRRDDERRVAIVIYGDAGKAADALQKQLDRATELEIDERQQGRLSGLIDELRVIAEAIPDIESQKNADPEKLLEQARLAKDKKDREENKTAALAVLKKHPKHKELKALWMDSLSKSAGNKQLETSEDVMERDPSVLSYNRNNGKIRALQDEIGKDLGLRRSSGTYRWSKETYNLENYYKHRYEGYEPETPAEETAPAPEHAPLATHEALNTHKQVRVTAPEGTSQLRVTDGSGRKTVMPLKDVDSGGKTSKQGDNPLRGAGPFTKVEAGTMRGKEFVPMRGEVSVTDAAAEQGLRASDVLYASGPSEEPSGIKHAYTDEQRAKMGMPERGEWIGRTDENVVTEAKRREEAIPALVAELTLNPRAITAIEGAMLMRANSLAEQRHESAMDAIIEANGNADALAVGRKMLADAENELQNLYTIAETVGSEQGHAFRFRQRMLNRDFTLAEMLKIARAKGNNGEELSEKAREIITRQHAELEALKEKMRKMEDEASKAAAQMTYEEMYAAALDEIEATRKAKDRKKADAEKKALLKAWLVQDGWGEEKGEGLRASSGGTPKLNAQQVQALASMGRIVISEGADTPEKFTEAMVAEVGERFRPYAEKIYPLSKKLHAIIEAKDERADTAKGGKKKGGKRGKKPAKIKTPAEVLAGIEGEPSAQEVYELVKAHVAAGAGGGPTGEGRAVLEAAITATTDDLQSLALGWTERQVRDMFTEYGKVKYPSAEDLAVKLREIRRLGHIVSQTEDAKAKLKNLELEGPQQTGMRRDKATQAIRDQTKIVNLLMKEVDEKMALLGIKNPRTEGRIKSALDAAKTRMTNAIEDVQREIATKERTPKAQRGLQYDAEAKALKARLDALRETRDAMLGVDSATDEAAKEKALESSIAKLEEKLASGVFGRNPGVSTVDTVRVAALKSIRDNLRRKVDEARKAQRPAPDMEQRELERIESEIARLLENKPKAGKEQGPDTEEQAFAREQLAALRAMRDEARKADPALQLAAAKKAIITRTAALKQRIADGDFIAKEKKPPMMDDEREALQYEYDKVRKEFLSHVFEMKLANRMFPARLMDKGKEIINTTRALVTSVDLSAVFRQGAFIGLAHPFRSAQALIPMLRAFTSAKYSHAVNERIRKRENYRNGFYSRGKLYIADNDGVSLAKMEEAYMSRWIEKLPTWTIAGPLLRGSQRAYITFLNLLRADTFDAMLGGLAIDPANPSKAELEAIGNFINAATGRGKLWRAESAGAELNTLFFSARLVTSRFQLLMGQPLVGGSIRTRKLVAKEYARFITGIAVVYALAMAAQDDDDKPIEIDPRSSDFGKVRFGNTRLDPMAGLLQPTVLGARLISGKTKRLSGEVVPLRGEGVPYRGDTTADVITRFLRTKLAPAASAVADWADDQRNVVGQPVTAGSTAKQLVYPMSVKDISEALDEHGLPKGAILGMLSALGMGVSTYDANKPRSGPMADTPDKPVAKQSVPVPAMTAPERKRPTFQGF